MKTTFSSFAISTLILSAAVFAAPIESARTHTAKIEQAQVVAGFDFFRTHRQGKGITAVWGMANTSGVAGFSVKRTYEDPSDEYAEWQEVAYGGCDGSKSYKCNDKNVAPGFVNYKVVAILDDGTTVESAVSTVHIMSR